MEKETRKNIEEKIKFSNISPHTLDTLKIVLDNAEKFYKKN